MSSDSTANFSESSATARPDGNDAVRNGEVVQRDAASIATAPEQTGARPNDGETSATSRDTQSDSAPQDKAPVKPVSAVKVKMRNDLPALADDGDVGVEKEQIVTRDEKADLGFTGVLLASAAPASVLKDSWQEYRIYRTNGGKHVFSKVTRTILADKDDTYDAEVFDPAPESGASKLLKSVHDLTHTRPTTWMDAAVSFFGYDPLAKVLYRKLGVGFEEQIT